jgi:antitoxin HicB
MKDVNYYLGLPYTVVLRRDQQGDVVARVEEIPGCAAHGKTAHEALDNLDEVKELWIRDCVERGDPVPEPEVEEPLPSGKWLQRVPKSLHKKLVSVAKREAISLNQLVSYMLAEAVGIRILREGKGPAKVVDTWTGHPAAEGEEEDIHVWSIVGRSPEGVLRTRADYLELLKFLLTQRASSKARMKAHAHEEEEAYQFER